MTEGYIYYLHYVGKGLYSKTKFVHEARKYGVSRALPASQIKKLEWGEPILLAFYEVIDDVPTADVFGYFYFTRLRHAGLTAEASDELLSRLDVVRIDRSPPQLVVRGCGSYIQGGSAIVRDKPRDIIKKAEEIEEKYGIRIKWFVEGDFHSLPQILIRPVKFARGLLKVRLDVDIKELRDVRGTVVFSYDYRQNIYVRKGVRESLPLEEFFHES